MIVKTKFPEKFTQFEFSGKTEKDIVLEMSRNDWICKGKWDYMSEVQNRLNLIFEIEIEIEFGNYKKFIEELKRVDLIEIITLN